MENGPKENGPKENGPKENGPKENGPKENGKDRSSSSPCRFTTVWNGRVSGSPSCLLTQFGACGTGCGLHIACGLFEDVMNLIIIGLHFDSESMNARFRRQGSNL